MTTILPWWTLPPLLLTALSPLWLLTLVVFWKPQRWGSKRRAWPTRIP
jgi:hypothetical protein